MPRRSAERRARPQADARGNADHSWRAPHWPRTRMRSAEVPVRILPCAPFGAPPPLIFLEANAFVQWLGKARAQRRVARTILFYPPPREARGRGTARSAVEGVQLRRLVFVAGASLRPKGVAVMVSRSPQEFRRGLRPLHRASRGPPPPLRFATRGRMKNAPRAAKRRGMDYLYGHT